MNKQVLHFGDALGFEVAYSNAISVDLSETKRMISVSGQLAFDEDGNLIGENDMKVQTDQCIKNISNALEKLGGSLDDIIKVTVFVKDMSTLADIHEVRMKYFNKPYPTSTLVQITEFAFPGALIEIEALAVVDSTQ